MTRVRFPRFSVELPDDWDDVTDETGGDLPTIARVSEDGKGALQVSMAEYRAGAIPRIDEHALEELREDFARARKLGEPIDSGAVENDLLMVVGSYRSESDFVRVWYLSDRTNIALITYICDWSFWKEEIGDCEKIVKSFRFTAGA